MRSAERIDEIWRKDMPTGPSIYQRGRPSCGKEWDYFQSKESAHFRRLLSRRFKNLFGKGHAISLRPILKQIEIRFKKGNVPRGILFDDLHYLHPDALALLIRYGVDYEPLIWTEKLPEPEAGRCFANAWQMTYSLNQRLEEGRGPFLYVEGIVWGAAVRPMLHAWCTERLNGKMAIDWTHYPVARWSRYVGIPFTLEEHRELRKLTLLGESLALMFRKKYYTEKFHQALTATLKKREKTRRASKTPR